jgi:sec-independent protein translocase protein TatC
VTDGVDAPPGRRASRPPRPRAGEGGLAVMSVVEHLEDLRRTLFFMLAVAGAAAVGGWFVAPWALDAVVGSRVERVYFSSPSEGFMIRMKVSLMIGLLVALPILIGRLWGFVAPGLFRHERRAVVPVLVSGALLFYGGVAFAFAGVVPRMVEFFLSFGGDRIAPLLNVTEYFMFVAKFCLAFGLAFQLPLVIVLLAALGIVTPQKLWSQWRYGVIVIFVVAAWLTPPDVVSQLLMGGPLVVLYLLSLLASFIVVRRRRPRPH